MKKADNRQNIGTVLRLKRKSPYDKMSMLKNISEAGKGSKNTISWMMFLLPFPAPDRQAAHSVGGFTH